LAADPLMDFASVGPGFVEPVGGAQRTFRCVLDAMAHPGRIACLPPDLLVANEAGLSSVAAAIALTLIDFETPVWLDHALARAASFLRFHCHAPIATTPERCRFAFAADIAGLPPPDAFDLGTEDYPDRSTTLILEVPALDQGPILRLRGPGIRDETILQIQGLSKRFWDARAALASRFPLGLDLILTAGDRLACLPRTTIAEA
jgi:alpha-D-ribose 1-methylphosphonate 5-triphosphate synthase subunit PhnH